MQNNKINIFQEYRSMWKEKKKKIVILKCMICKQKQFVKNILLSETDQTARKKTFYYYQKLK